jgi:hypothetical protein
LNRIRLTIERIEEVTWFMWWGVGIIAKVGMLGAMAHRERRRDASISDGGGGPEKQAPRVVNTSVVSGGFASSPMAILARSLGPALAEACGGPGRLTDLRWFRSDQQRGGGSTGFATYVDEHGRSHQAVVKVPVGYSEWDWTVKLSRLQETEACPITPRVLASGLEVGGHDIAWLVLERLDKGVTEADGGLAAEDVEQMLGACGRVQGLMEKIKPPAGIEPRRVDFEMMLQRSREAIRRSPLYDAHDQQMWVNELKAVHRVLPILVRRWEGRPKGFWCHGDLHGGNAMRRSDGSIALIDLALVHTGHWIEDALYIERVYWARPDLLHGINPLKCLAGHRRKLGLACEGDYGQLACVRRVLTAACGPALIEREGNKAYLDAALEVIRKYIQQAAHV